MITSSADVAIVGAGPAGVAAACRATELGASVILLDEGLAPGGQIYRHLPHKAAPPDFQVWQSRLERSHAKVVFGASVFEVERTGSGFRLAADTQSGLLEVKAPRLVLATGARELFLPFPGWTLPGVMGAGGAQALYKNGFDVAGKRVVVAGSGPLLWPVAASLFQAGARLELVAEQAGLGALLGFGFSLMGLARHKVLEVARYRAQCFGAPFRAGTWVKAARGRKRVSSVRITDGEFEQELECELLCVSYGLVPNSELGRYLGAEVNRDRLRVDLAQETSIEGLYAAGEPCGVAGVDVAVVEGQIAGLAAAGQLHPEAPEVRQLFAARARGRRLAARMDSAFRLRAPLCTLPPPETLVCRCEDVRAGALDRRWTLRQAKLYTRIGMGACQGRVCGAALAHYFNLTPDTARSPLKPVPLGVLASPRQF